MSDIDIKEAFDILNISISADVDEINEAYRELSRQNHPDANDGDNQLQKKINRARDIAVDFVSRKEEVYELVKNSIDKELSKVSVHRRYRSRAKDSAKRFKNRKTRPLHTAKYIAVAIAAFSGLLGWLGSDFLPIIINEPSETVKRYAKMVSSTVGISAIIMQMIVAYIKRNVQSLEEKLNNITNCARELAQLLEYEDAVEVDESDIFRLSRQRSQKRKVSRNPFNLTSAPSYERARLVLLKSVEHGLLIPHEPEEVTPNSKTTYEVDFSPSKFKPNSNDEKSTNGVQKYISKKSSEELTREIVFDASVVFFFLIASSLVWYFTSGKWFYLPLAISALPLPSMVLHIIEYIKRNFSNI